MSKSDKQWVKPDDLAKQKQNDYERKRNKKVKENEKRVKAMGFKHIPASLSSFVHYVPVKGNGKRIRAEADDDYNSPGNEDDNDYDSDDSFEQEVVRMQVVPEMQPGTSYLQRAPTRNQHVVSPICERVTRLTSHPDGKIIEVEVEHCTEAGVTPMTQEELSIKSLKAKSGYVKGLGMSPSSSLRTTVASAANNQYVSHLESLVQEYQECN